jgi:hypothetical protein
MSEGHDCQTMTLSENRDAIAAPRSGRFKNGRPEGRPKRCCLSIDSTGRLRCCTLSLAMDSIFFFKKKGARHHVDWKEVSVTNHPLSESADPVFVQPLS